MVIVAILGYFICKYRKIHIQTLSELKHLKWFLCRNATAYIFITCWIKMYSYFRVSTISVVCGTSPLIIILLSVFLLDEKFYIRYIYGVFLCIVGSSVIIFNDKNPQSKAQILNDNIFVGILFSIGNIGLYSLSMIGQKVLVKEGMDFDLQNYYFGLYNTVPALVVYIFSGEFLRINIYYCLFVMTNGIIFYLANYFTCLCLKYIAISKFQPITYLSIVFIFILSAIILGEPVFFTDLIGASIIIGFQYYNMKYPPGRSVNEENIKQSNIKTQNSV
jgi:drug/metabolite transporter (DMT)-like permease